MSIPEKTAARVSKAREAADVNQSAFARRLGVSRNYVSMVENGKEPGRKFLEKLLELEIALGLHPASDANSPLTTEHLDISPRVLERPEAAHTPLFECISEHIFGRLFAELDVARQSLDNLEATLLSIRPATRPTIDPPSSSSQSQSQKSP